MFDRYRLLAQSDIELNLFPPDHMSRIVTVLVICHKILLFNGRSKIRQIYAASNFTKTLAKSMVVLVDGTVQSDHYITPIVIVCKLCK